MRNPLIPELESTLQAITLESRLRRRDRLADVSIASAQAAEAIRRLIDRLQREDDARALRVGLAVVRRELACPCGAAETGRAHSVQPWCPALDAPGGQAHTASKADLRDALRDWR